MRWLALLTSISIAVVAAWYSIIGLMAIFAGAKIAIAIMGAVLEVGKLVTAAWLHGNWKAAPWLMKSYLTFAVLVLMVITSLGIFGFLSKAHLEHTISTGGINDLQITNLERQIQNEERTISDSTVVIAQLDRTVATLLEYDRVRGPDGAVATRKAQSDERDAMNAAINDGYAKIEDLQARLTPLQQEKLAIEVEVGPLKYIAEMVYGEENAKDYLDEAVRGVIILIIVCFDPLAVVLLLAASMGFRQKKMSKVFYDDGNHKISPNNVVSIDVEEPQEYTEEVILDIPDDEDLEDYEIYVPEDDGLPEIVAGQYTKDMTHREKMLYNKKYGSEE